MNCLEFQKQRTFTEVETELSAEARHHFATCQECQIYLRDEDKLRLHIRRLAEEEHAPESLTALFAESHSRPAKRTKAVSWQGIAVAAFILFCVSGASLLWYSHAHTPSPTWLNEAFVADHVRYLPGHEELVSDDPEQIESWFQGRIDFPVHVPEVPGASLQDARICDISGRKAALLHYRSGSDHALISVFVATEPKAFEREKKPISVTASARGVNSVLWCRRGLVYDVVGDTDQTALQKIVDAVKQQGQ